MKPRRTTARTNRSALGNELQDCCAFHSGSPTEGQGGGVARCSDVRSLLSRRGVIPSGALRPFFHFIVTALFLSGLGTVVAHSASAEDGRLNQLDFDIKGGPPPPMKKVEPTEEDLRALTEGTDESDPASVGASPSPAARPTPSVQPSPAARPAEKGSIPAAGATAVPLSKGGGSPTAAVVSGGPFKVTRYEWEKMPDAEPHYLTPKLRGPTTDGGSEFLITTAGSWTKGKKGCQEIEDAEQLCRKAKALKELFNRFSGDDDFYNSNCVAPCELPNATAVLTGFVVVDTRRGDFKVLEKGTSCQYQLKASAPENRWVALEGKRGVCSCLPASCGVK